MRPASIVKFERTVLLLVVMSLATAVMAWDQTAAQIAAQGLGESVLIGALAVLLGLTLLLAWLASRRRSNLGRWLYVVLIVVMLGISAPSIPRIIENGSTANLVMNLAYVLLCVVSVVLLFRPDSNAWFAGSRDGDGGDTGTGTAL